MRYGYTDTLGKYLVGSPTLARPLVETVITTSSDVLDTKADFNAADSTSGFAVYNEGGARLSGVASKRAENTTRNTGSDITALVPPISATIDCAVFEWKGADYTDAELVTATAYLDPDTGGGQEVTYWAAQLFRVARINAVGILGTTWDLVAISRLDYVEETAGAAGNVSFTFTDSGQQNAPVIGEPPEGIATTTARTVLMVWALKGNGEVAGNVAWECDHNNSSIDVGPYPGLGPGDATISRYQLTLVDGQTERGQGLRYSVGAASTGVPACQVAGRQYTAATITWTTNDIDIGAAPAATTDLEVVAEYAVPSDSTVVVQIDDGVQGWTTVYDGDVIGQDNSPDPLTNPLDTYANSGADLSSFLRQQNYDIRSTVTPDGTSQVTPRLFRLGVREVTREVVDALVEVQGAAWGVDPISCQSEIPTVELTLHRDGVRDYRSFAEELFTDNHLNDIEFRVYIGHPELARQFWLHIDNYLVESYRPTEAGIEVSGVSPLQYVLAPVPPRVTTARDAIAYSGSTLKAVYDDIIDGQVGVAGRYQGPGVEGSTTVTKTITDKTQAIDVLREICFLDGCALTTSQGRFKTVKLFDKHAPERTAVFPMGDIAIRGIDVGFDRRLTEFNVPYGYTESTNVYTGERNSAASAAAISNLGPTAVGQDAQLDDSTARWIEDSTVAFTIGNRIVTYFGTGLPQLRFTSSTPKPWLEVGDSVAVEQDVYVGRDPNRDQGIRGRQWALGRITQCHDVMGTEFTVWIQSWVDFLPTDTGVTRTGIQTVEKKLVIPAGALSYGSSLTVNQAEAKPSALTTTSVGRASLPLPAGAVITAISTKCCRINAADAAVVTFSAPSSYTNSPPSYVSLDYVTHTHDVNATSWTTKTTTGLTTTVNPAKPFAMKVSLYADAAVGNAKFAWAEITYTEPIRGIGRKRDT